MCTELLLPQVSDFQLTEIIKSLLTHWLLKENERVGEIVHKADVSNTGEPVLLTLRGDGEELGSDVIQNVAMKMADHAKHS